MNGAPFATRPEPSAAFRLYEFAKTALIRIFASPYSAVCDLYCTTGSDTRKWLDAHIGHYIGFDDYTYGVNEAREAWDSQPKPCDVDIFDIDPCSEDNLDSYWKDRGIQVDIVSCLQHLQACFETEEKARRLLHNVSSLLRPGGYFIGIAPDSSTIWTKYQKMVEAGHNKSGGIKPNSVPNCIRSENYTITFVADEEKFPLYGKRYQLKFASDVAPESHCLIHFPSLIRLAREAGLVYVEIQNLTEFYDDNRSQFAGALQNYGSTFVDPRGRLLARSFDLLSLYSTIIFQKPDPDLIPPPILTPIQPDTIDRDPSSRRKSRSFADEEGSHHMSGVVGVDQSKGILGPGPAELRFQEFG